MSIWQKIKSGWIVRQEKRRNWWAAPAIHAALKADSEHSMGIALLSQSIREIETDLDARFKDVRRTFGDRIALAESRILDRVQESHRQLNVIEGDIQKGEEATARGLQNVFGRLELGFNDVRFLSGSIIEAVAHLSLDNAEIRRQLHSLFVSVDGGFTGLTTEARVLLAQLHLVGNDVREQVRFDVVKSDIQEQTRALLEVMKGHGDVSYDLVGRALAAVEREHQELNTLLIDAVKALSERLAGLEDQVNGIRSRYRWVEDRYADLSKGVVPRHFDYDKRQ